MASGNAVLTGFPPVLRVDLWQGTGAKPGRIVVDTLVLNDDLATLPKVTTLTMYARNYTGVWGQIRMLKKPRIFRGYMRTVFLDSRWRLQDKTLGKNYNDRDCNGTIYAASEATVSQLASVISTPSGLTITPVSVPAIKPKMNWRGKSCDKALDELLATTGCRLVYDPVGQRYNLAPGNQGSIPSICDQERRFTQGPKPAYRNLIVKSAPKTFEERFAATAVVFDEDNDPVTVANGEKIFSGFDNYDSFELLLRHRHQQTAFRLWNVTPGTKMLLGRRALSLMPGDSDECYCGAQFVKPLLADVPRYVDMVQPDGYTPNALGLTGGGRFFVSQHPYLEADGSSIKTTAEIICAFYEGNAGNFTRDSVTVPLHGDGQSDLEVALDWIRPVESSEDDIDGSAWTALHQSVANAMATKYTGIPQHLLVRTLVNHEGIGQVGAVRYMMKIGHNALIQTAIAFNFEPADSRGM